jgi:4-amino-4-deoxy-L-arabinose transferase-like glycosyltransferase
VIALCLAGATIRFATLGEQSFWLDEAVTGRLMHLGFVGMLRAIPRSESTPPLYYVLAWLWTRVFGVTEVGLRSLSAVFGTLTIPLVHMAAARVFDRRAGLFAAALATFAPLLIWYSQEARSYALLVALCTASVWTLVAAVEPNAGRRWLWSWAVVSGLALATHYFAAFLIGPELCWVIAKRRRAGLPAAGVVVLAGLAVAPLALRQRANGTAGFITQTGLPTRLAQAVKQLAIGYDAPADGLIVGLGCVLGVAAIWLAWRRLAETERLRALGIVGLGIAATGLPVLAAGLGFDYVITRNVIATWVPVSLAVAAGLARSGRAGTVVLIGVCSLGLAVTLGVDLDGRYQRDDWRGVARAVPTGTLSALVVTPSSGRLALQYYLPRSRPVGPTGAKVTTVEVIALGARSGGNAVVAPPLASHPPTLAGFGAPVASVHATFSVVRYHATAGAALVTAPILASLAPSPASSIQLLSRGS